MDSDFDYKTAWLVLNQTFPILSNPLVLPEQESENIPLDVLNIIKMLNLNTQIETIIIRNIETRLRKTVVPEFWSHFQKTADINYRDFYQAISMLFQHFVKFETIMNKLGILRNAMGSNKPIYNLNCLHDVLRLILRASLLAQIPNDYQLIISNFYETALKMMESEICDVCLQQTYDCSCSQIFHETNM